MGDFPPGIKLPVRTLFLPPVEVRSPEDIGIQGVWFGLVLEGGAAIHPLFDPVAVLEAFRDRGWEDAKTTPLFRIGKAFFQAELLSGEREGEMKVEWHVGHSLSLGEACLDWESDKSRKKVDLPLAFEALCRWLSSTSVPDGFINNQALLFQLKNARTEQAHLEVCLPGAHPPSGPSRPRL
jgi:hypothetical protein